MKNANDPFMEYMNNYIQKLVDEFSYKKLPKEKSKEVREFFYDNIPCRLFEDYTLFDLDNHMIARGFERIVVGDYGAFIEIAPNEIIRTCLKIQDGQDFRLDANFKGKYIWLTSNGKNKIYEQLRTVSYADYKVGYFYISPYEIKQKIRALID